MNTPPVTEYFYNEYAEYDEIINENPPPFALVLALVITRAIITFLGIAGNGLVIWITGFKMKKSINTVFYLSLAVSDFLFSVSLAISIFYLVQNNWSYNSFLCKFRSFYFFLNMFSSVFLLVIISVDRCIVVLFPVWVQNNRTVRRASVMVVLAWIVSALLSMPETLLRNVKRDYPTHAVMCFYRNVHKDFSGFVISRFIFGFIIPFLVIIVCYLIIIQKLMNSQITKSMKPFKIMTALIVVFFICWLPHHIFTLLQLHWSHGHYLDINVIYIGHIVCTALAGASCVLNPFLYAFIGREIKKTFYSFLSSIEKAIQVEDRHIV